MRLSRTLVIMLLIVSLLAGCAGDSEKIESGNLKILSGFDKTTFDMIYGGQIFEQTNSAFEVTYVNAYDHISPADWDDYVRLLEMENPDVVVIGSLFDYYKLASAGLLVDLNPKIRKDSFELNSIQPSVLTLLKYPGELHEQYGLSPFYNPSALYYNKTLFEHYGIPLPTDGMTWGDMLRLAARFPNKGDDGQPIYGYHHREFSTPSYYLDYLASIEGLSMIEGTRFTMDKAHWGPLLERLISVFKGKSVSYAENGSEVQSRMGNPEATGEMPFLEGRVAMFLAPAAFMERLNEQSNSFEWGIVSQAVSLGRGKSMPTFPSPIYSIYRYAQNVDAAWRYVRYMNETSTLKLLSKSVPLLSSHVDVGTERYGRSLAPFYGAEAVPPSMEALGKPSLVPPFFISQTIYPLIDTAVASVLDGEKSLDEILISIQEQGQAELDAALVQAGEGA
ncbi:ABC transporter substrate-binding protein [Cohnella mopanensis]|uniref:ABC transporter substrate-binding protein n=1 Tax=Cohnella mopanensis TaxID=2911966 RepID=UPI001EF81290|nr:extracellular solute-binding protein [Cohnella mopanensis]